MRAPFPPLFILCALIAPLCFAGDGDGPSGLPDLSQFRLHLQGMQSPAAVKSQSIPSKIDACYSDPSLALKPGTQSTFDEKQAADLLKEAGVMGKDGYTDAALIQRWMTESFQAEASGGTEIGKSTVQSLLKARKLTGCHDWGLMKAALLRSAGYPARMADTAGVQWMSQVRANEPAGGFKGHIFVEAYVDGKWILLDSTSPRYLAGYDRANPYIPMKVGDQDSYYDMFKGADPADYGLGSVDQLNAYMTRFAKTTNTAGLSAPGKVTDLPDVGKPLPYFSDETLSAPCKEDARHNGMVLQFKDAGLDVHVEKTGKTYTATTYNYGQVFGHALKTLPFATMGELRAYLRSLQNPQ
jgi:hypothetical protein